MSSQNVDKGMGFVDRGTGILHGSWPADRLSEGERERELQSGPEQRQNRGMAFDPAKAEAVLDQIAAGASLRQTIAAPSTICRWAAENPTFAERYARARELRADVHAGRIEDLADKVESGDIAPDAARVAIDARKWTASKLHSKRYGDKIQVDQDLRMQVEVIDCTKAIVDATVLQAQQPLPALICESAKPIESED